VLNQDLQVVQEVELVVEVQVVVELHVKEMMEVTHQVQMKELAEEDTQLQEEMHQVQRQEEQVVQEQISVLIFQEQHFQAVEFMLVGVEVEETQQKDQEEQVAVGLVNNQA